jgi:hypothetical protein
MAEIRGELRNYKFFLHIITTKHLICNKRVRSAVLQGGAKL